jgi:hypothetical protein
MSFDRASALYMGALKILNDPDAEVTPGERAIIYASLAQVETAVSTAVLIQEAFPGDRADTEALQAEEVLASSSQRLISRILDDHLES